MGCSASNSAASAVELDELPTDDLSTQKSPASKKAKRGNPRFQGATEESGAKKTASQAHWDAKKAGKRQAQLKAERQSFEARHSKNGGLTEADDIGREGDRTKSQKSKEAANKAHWDAKKAEKKDAQLKAEKEKFAARRSQNGGATKVDDVGDIGKQTKAGEARQREFEAQRAKKKRDSEFAQRNTDTYWDRQGQNGGHTVPEVGHVASPTLASERRRQQLEEKRRLKEEEAEEQGRQTERWQRRHETGDGTTKPMDVGHLGGDTESSANRRAALEEQRRLKEEAALAEEEERVKQQELYRKRMARTGGKTRPDDVGILGRGARASKAGDARDTGKVVAMYSFDGTGRNTNADRFSPNEAP